MKPYFNISNLLDGYNALLAGWTLLLAGIFGAYWYLFAALLLFNVLDWLSGWYKARRLHEESSKVGLQGVMKKLCYWMLIAVAFTAAAVFEAVGADVLAVDLSCMHLLGWSSCRMAAPRVQEAHLSPSLLAYHQGIDARP